MRQSSGVGKDRSIGAQGRREKGTAARRSVRGVLALLVPFVVILGVVYALYALEVPLGEPGHFVYRYSPLLTLRLLRSAVLLPGVGMLVAAAWGLCQRGRGERAAGTVAGVLALVWAAGWTWWLPPGPLQQHTMNLLSPSHDGAFLIEALHFSDTGEYLRDFDRHIQQSVENMRGTRVLSNPPGMTVLAEVITHRFSADMRHPGVFERAILAAGTNAEDVPPVAEAMKYSVLLTGMWALSGVFAYLLGRVFLSSAGALVFATIVTFNPATVNFVPGKDPAQLLTINAMLWAWFMGVRRRSAVWTGIGGAALMLGMAVGLIHLWVALAALVAAVWGAWREREALGEALVRYLVGPAVGAGVVVGATYAWCGWNLLRTLVAVARRYSEVQQTIHYDRRLWLVIGLPLFLLFLSPAFYSVLMLARRHWRSVGSGARAGLRIFLATVAVMLLVYVVGITYELPRLWVAFVPLLTLGACMEWPVLRHAAPRRTFVMIAAVLVVNVVGTALHVAALDARESEYRLIDQRLFN